jgi:hypothetical protein
LNTEGLVVVLYEVEHMGFCHGACSGTNPGMLGYANGACMHSQMLHGVLCVDAVELIVVKHQIITATAPDTHG